MATDLQNNANRENAQHSTGPRTETGKAISARNALTLGLFTQSDYVRPDEQEEYDQLCTRFVTELNPDGILEDAFVAALVTANWRLRRCALVEYQLAGGIDIDLMADKHGGRIQDSVDRARSLAFNMLRRATMELRRLQTDRAIAAKLAALEADKADEADRAEKTPLVSEKQVVVCIDQHEKFKRNQSDKRKSASNCKNSAPIPIDRRTKTEDFGRTGTEDRRP